MLVLTRKPGEVIAIGEEIEIKIISVEGEAVRVGISAPREMAVHRSEVLAAIAEENRRAAGSADGLKSLGARLTKEKER
jgi:carbon storage regulator